jgi:macrolide-specific efflux system membrane fusion protein
MRRFAPVLLVTMFVLAACANQSLPEDESTPTPFPTPSKPTFIVQRGDIIRETEFYGRIAPVASREAFFALDGRVANVYVSVGDEVKAGQLLADLDDLADLQEEWAAANEEVLRQQEVAGKVIRRAEIDLEIAELTLGQYQSEGRSPFEIQIQTLEVERAQMALDEVKADPALLASTDKVKELEAQMELAQLVAPADGTIVAAVEEGQSVRTNTTAFVIGEDEQLEVRATVNDETLKELYEEMLVTVTLQSQPDAPLEAVIRQLPFPYGSAGSDNNDGSVRVRLTNLPPAGFELGEEATIVAVLAQKPATLWLPPDAIRSAGGRVFVFVQTDSGPKQVNITTGVTTKERVEILEGLSEGDIVIAP